MTDRVVEILSNGCILRKDQGFLCIQRRDEPDERIDLDTIGAVVVAAPDAVITRGIHDELARRGIVVVFCGLNYQPTGVVVPILTTTPTAERIEAQVRATKPKKKQLWKSIIQQKIHNQAIVLDSIARKLEAKKLRQYEQDVKSGDLTNREASAARCYWNALMGREFRRSKDAGGVNACLNYGYAILRSAFARAVCAAGLTPAIGLGHSSPRNGMCLVDDLLEPYRPIVDITVWRMGKKTMRVSPEVKQILSEILVIDLFGKKGTTPLSLAAYEVVYDLIACLTGPRRHLHYPVMLEVENGLPNPTLGLPDHVDDCAV